MSRKVKIDGLRIRVPWTVATDPKALAASVARHLADASRGWTAAPSQSVQVKVPATGVNRNGLASTIARSVNTAVRKGGSR